MLAYIIWISCKIVFIVLQHLEVTTLTNCDKEYGLVLLAGYYLETSEFSFNLSFEKTYHSSFLPIIWKLNQITICEPDVN